MTDERKTVAHSFTLNEFQNKIDGMIAIGENHRNYGLEWAWESIRMYRDYTLEQIHDIIKSGDIGEKQKLSNYYFYINGFYREILLYYSTLLKYIGILIPNPVYGKSLQEPSLTKRYIQAQKFVDRLRLQDLGPRIAFKTLLNGTYYGMIQTKSKNEFFIMDLPVRYCRSRFVDKKGNLIVEFDVTYFDSIKKAESRQAALKLYPEEVRRYYSAYKNGAHGPWMLLDTSVGFAFQFFDERPLLLSLIPSTVQYDKSIETDQLRHLEEIKKILINKIDHLNDGTLLFEPQEVEVMHKGIVGMLKTSNPLVSVLSTYGDVTIEDSHTTDSNNSNTIANMRQNVYANAGVSGDIFSASGSGALSTSIQNDVSLMMVLGNKIALFVKNIINDLYKNTNIDFNYILLPISYYNDRDYTDTYYKMASAGYPLLLPIIAQGINPIDLINLKSLENDVLKLGDVLKPLQTSYTQSSDSNSNSEETTEVVEPVDEGGRPEVATEEKSATTIETEESRK